MVMSDDSCLRGCGFESWHRTLDGHFFALICCKNCIVCLKRPKRNEKNRPELIFLTQKQNHFSSKFIQKVQLVSSIIQVMLFVSRRFSLSKMMPLE